MRLLNETQQYLNDSMGADWGMIHGEDVYATNPFLPWRFIGIALCSLALSSVLLSPPSLYAHGVGGCGLWLVAGFGVWCVGGCGGFELGGLCDCVGVESELWVMGIW
jgi:hypothetical protein